MSEFKGTPGPWFYSGKHEDCEVRYVGTSDEHDIFNEVAVLFTEKPDVRQANANLIAAAPELLEACLRIQAQFRQAGVESKSGSLNPVEDNAAQIDAVISKALGQ